MGLSSLFKMFGQQMPQTNSGFASMLGEFQKFKQSFSGNPQQQVQQLLNNGLMTQQQFQKLSQAATQFQQMMRGRF